MGWKKSLASIYSGVQSFRNFLYDFGLADSVRLQQPVLSVGNLSMGGSGKTPMVAKIIEMALQKGLRPCVVSRNYRALSVDVQRVQLERESGADFYGDEAFLLAKRFPDIPVYTGPLKYVTAEMAQERESCDFFILDDGFQHRSLHRDFDLVLLDASTPEEEDAVLPVGNLREPFSSLHRAQLVGLTKVNWAEPERVAQLRENIPVGIEFFQIEFQLQPVQPIPAEARVLLLSGIAKPMVFAEQVRKYSQSQAEAGTGTGTFSVTEVLSFTDHHPYSRQDIDRILNLFHQQECTQILTTEKDFVKLEKFSELQPLLNWMRLELNFQNEPRGLSEFFNKIVGK
ncbi:MAG: tetraacyldisaccharide 4'-kinase [Bdellovibrio sp. CG10_big_fil_rev_8_21_14_0_10_47_8]|nr:MAG: tetraacyldisaccharide 4'-kinase [Bdellovibrio sp. CG10_big_fil_rev_8_21_14_0_10_47_8]